VTYKFGYSTGGPHFNSVSHWFTGSYCYNCKTEEYGK